MFQLCLAAEPEDEWVGGTQISALGPGCLQWTQGPDSFISSMLTCDWFISSTLACAWLLSSPLATDWLTGHESGLLQPLSWLRDYCSFHCRIGEVLHHNSLETIRDVLFLYFYQYQRRSFSMYRVLPKKYQKVWQNILQLTNNMEMLLEMIFMNSCKRRWSSNRMECLMKTLPVLLFKRMKKWFG